MKIIKYFFEFIFISFLLIIFKIIGYKLASNFGEKIGKIFGPFFRSEKKILENLELSKIGKDHIERKKILSEMWGNYGRILSEYVHLKNFRTNKLNNLIEIKGKNYLDDIKSKNKKVVFVSGHFSNFELMAQQLEVCGLDVAAIYRPLNNIFLNKYMESIRINNICKKQIPKGKSGSRKIIEYFNKGSSIALMIDQRVSEGIKVNFFKRPAFTTTLPAQLIKKFNCEVVPIYIERKNNIYFEMTVKKPLKFDYNNSLEDITLSLNEVLEEMIVKKPEQWIWSHNRWK